MEEKIRDYVRKESRAEVTGNIFDALFFEFKVAGYFADKGFQVEFIKEQKNERSPDLTISSKNNLIAIECKKKRTEGFSIEKILDSVLEAKEQLEKSRIDGIIAVEFSHTEQTNLDLVDVETKIQKEIQDKPRILGVWLIGETNYIKNGKTHIVSHSKIFFNSNFENKIPSDIKKAILIAKAPQQKSLLHNRIN